MMFQIMEMFLAKHKKDKINYLKSEEEIISHGLAFKIQHILQKDKCFDIFKDIQKAKNQDNLLNNVHITN